jgi:hypothetical protein
MIDLSLSSNVFINNSFDEALQELDIILNTKYTELIGYPNFGTDFEQFLWQLNPAVDAIKEYINEKISDTIYLKKFRTEINVNLLKGQYRMIYNLVINIYDSNNKIVQRKYQFR